MHYIRFLKPPRLLSPSHRSQPLSLTSKITITTDLGESFLCRNIQIIVETVAEDGKTLLGAKGKEFSWMGGKGMRALEAVVPIVGIGKSGGVRMLVRPKDEGFAVDSFEDVLKSCEEGEGGVVAVRSLTVPLTIPKATPRSIPDSLAERVFRTSQGEDVHIWEETGESIARHIWDAGLILSSYLTTALSQTPTLQALLTNHPLNILELGAGCGIVGLTLFQTLPSSPTAPSQITLTDLPEATSILSKNISGLPTAKNSISHQTLNWSLPLPPSIATTTWNLILIADCTYNPDVVPWLVETLKKIAEGNREVLILLAMKVRHESELVFFELMRKGGFVVKEGLKVPLPVLGGVGEGEEIEGFVFGVGEG